jgi:hypothetical protein
MSDLNETPKELLPKNAPRSDGQGADGAAVVRLSLAKEKPNREQSVMQVRPCCFCFLFLTIFYFLFVIYYNNMIIIALAPTHRRRADATRRDGRGHGRLAATHALRHPAARLLLPLEGELPLCDTVPPLCDSRHSPMPYGSALVRHPPLPHATPATPPCNTHHSSHKIRHGPMQQHPKKMHPFFFLSFSCPGHH